MSEPIQPSEAADILGVTPSTIRRWIAWHAAHLSPGANPAPGGRRRLTGRDIEVLREVKRLREEGLTTDQVNGRVGNFAFPDLPQPEAPTDAPGEAITPIASADMPMLSQAAIEALVTLPARVEAQQTRIEALEAQRLKVDVVWIGVACFIAGLIVGLAVWWFQ